MIPSVQAPEMLMYAYARKRLESAQEKMNHYWDCSRRRVQLQEYTNRLPWTPRPCIPCLFPSTTNGQVELMSSLIGTKALG